MVDNFALLISHGLIAIAVWRLMVRDDLDYEDPPEPDTEPAGFYAKSHVKQNPQNPPGAADA